MPDNYVDKLQIMKTNLIKRIIDIFMTISLMCLMSYQVTGEKAHEWIGILMVILVIVHQVLNAKWYSALFKGRYNYYRIISTIINVALLISFALTAISGMAMSNHAVPFLYNIVPVNTARVMHLGFSYWSFILMGLHLGMHISVIVSKMPKSVKLVLSIIFIILAVYGFYLFLKSGIINYILFKAHFAFFDYEKNNFLVFFENFSILIFWTILGYIIANLVRNTNKDKY